MTFVCKYCGRPRLRIQDVCQNCRLMFRRMKEILPRGREIKNWDMLIEDVKVALVEEKLDRKS